MPGFAREAVRGNNRFILRIVVIAAIGGFLFGYDSGVISGALLFIVALAALVFYIAAFAIGLGPVFWLMISEIYPMKVRSKAMAVATVANWTFNFLVFYFFLALVAAIGRAGTFWLYAGLGVCAIVFFWFKVPETRDRPWSKFRRTSLVEAPQPVRRRLPKRQRRLQVRRRGPHKAVRIRCEAAGTAGATVWFAVTTAA